LPDTVTIKLERPFQFQNKGKEMSPKLPVYTCGVVAHDIDCLCDVVVTTPTPILVDPVDGWQGEHIAEFLDLCVPWTDASILKFLTAQLMFHDEFVIIQKQARLSESDRNQRRKTTIYFMTDEQHNELVDRVQLGFPPVAVRVYALCKFGVTMSPYQATLFVQQHRGEQQ
jgi:hypothetical protein